MKLAVNNVFRFSDGINVHVKIQEFTENRVEEGTETLESFSRMLKVVQNVIMNTSMSLHKRVARFWILME